MGVVAFVRSVDDEKGPASTLLLLSTRFMNTRPSSPGCTMAPRSSHPSIPGGRRKRCDFSAQQ